MSRHAITAACTAPAPILAPLARRMGRRPFNPGIKGLSRLLLGATAPIQVALLGAGVPVAVAGPEAAPPFEASVIAPDRQALQALRHHPLTVDHGLEPHEDGTVGLRVIGAREALEALRGQGLQVGPLTPHLRGAPSTVYRSPAEGGQLLRTLAQEGERAGFAVLGHSVERRPIEALWIGQPPGSDAPVVRLLGAHHGDEWSSFEVALAVAETLVDADGVDPDLTAWLDATTVWVVPYVNPDGVLLGSRYNRRGVDLNRNYDYGWSPLEFASGPRPFSEPEARAVRDAFHYAPPLLGLSLHSGAVNIGYVWNHTHQQAADHHLAEGLAWHYADHTTASGFWVTNGAAWYITYGDTNDWSYGRYGVLDFTVELTADKAPPPDAVHDFIEDHLQATLATLMLPPDLSIRVVDAETGEPISARARLRGPGGAARSAWGVSAPDTGWIHRHAEAGQALLEVQAPGYQPRQLPISLPAPPTEVALDPTGTVHARAVPPVAAPGSQFTLPVPVSGPIQLTRPNTSTGLLPRADGRVEIPAHLPPGPWSVRLFDGRVLPNALLVAAAPATSEVDLQGLTLVDPRLDAGTRAWGLWGTRRTLRPLAVLEDLAGRVVVALPEVEGLDVLVLSAGTHLAVADVQPADHGGSGASDEDGIGPPLLVGGASCGCAARPEAAPGALAVGLLALVLLARRRQSP